MNYSSNLALDLGFLHNWIQLSATAYKDWTVNQMIYTNLPLQAGMPGALSNVPVTIVNKGLEFSLQTENLNSRQFGWASTLTLTFPVNRLARYPGLSSSPLAGSLVPGKSINVVKGYQYKGVDPASGLFQFQDVNRDGVLDRRDFVAGGDPDPRYYGGLDQHFRYKNWEMDLFFEFRV